MRQWLEWVSEWVKKVSEGKWETLKNLTFWPLREARWGKANYAIFPFWFEIKNAEIWLNADNSYDCYMQIKFTFANAKVY